LITPLVCSKFSSSSTKHIIYQFIKK
jgi:hypothetical protein